MSLKHLLGRSKGFRSLWGSAGSPGSTESETRTMTFLKVRFSARFLNANEQVLGLKSSQMQYNSVQSTKVLAQYLGQTGHGTTLPSGMKHTWCGRRGGSRCSVKARVQCTLTVAEGFAFRQKTTFVEAEAFHKRKDKPGHSLPMPTKVHGPRSKHHTSLQLGGDRFSKEIPA